MKNNKKSQLIFLSTSVLALSVIVLNSIPEQERETVESALSYFDYYNEDAFKDLFNNDEELQQAILTNNYNAYVSSMKKNNLNYLNFVQFLELSEKKIIDEEVKKIQKENSTSLELKTKKGF